MHRLALGRNVEVNVLHHDCKQAPVCVTHTGHMRESYGTYERDMGPYGDLMGPYGDTINILINSILTIDFPHGPLPLHAAP